MRFGEHWIQKMQREIMAHFVKYFVYVFLYAIYFL